MHNLKVAKLLMAVGEASVLQLARHHEVLCGCRSASSDRPPQARRKRRQALSMSICLCMARKDHGAEEQVSIRMRVGSVSGVFTREGTIENPSLTEIFVVNDYVMTWLSAMAVIATLKRRALEGGSYRIHISLARLSIWLLEMGIFDKTYAREVGNTQGDHAYLSPELFEADTPCEHYLSVTDQVKMSEKPGFYKVPVVPRGSSRSEWLPRNGERS